MMSADRGREGSVDVSDVDGIEGACDDVSSLVAAARVSAVLVDGISKRSSAQRWVKAGALG